MTHSPATLHVLLALSLSSPVCLIAQNLPQNALPADRFLDRISPHPVGDQAERDRSAETYMALNIASPAEVERVLPSVIAHSRPGNELRIRGYATTFLLGIAIRPDGAALLSSSSEDVASLIVDPDPGIQKVAVAITDYVIHKTPAPSQKPYVSALQTAIQRPQTPQDVDADIMLPLLRYGASDPAAVRAGLDFLRRNDLASDTRRQLLSLGEFFELPDEVYQYLAQRLEDPDPTVRASALAAYAGSKTEFRTLGQPIVLRLANDPQENQQLRNLARQALAGKSGLNPNIDLPAANH